MVLNKRGGLTSLYTLMLGITIIVVGIALASPIVEIINIPMAELTCTAPASDWDQALCWLLDITKFATVGIIIFAGMAIIAARRYFEK